MKLLFIFFSVLMISCSKMELPPPTPKIECSDVVVWKNSYYSNILNRRVYRMQLKKKDGTYFTTDVWFDLYWSKNVGDRIC